MSCSTSIDTRYGLPGLGIIISQHSILYGCEENQGFFWQVFEFCLTILEQLDFFSCSSSETNILLNPVHCGTTESAFKFSLQLKQQNIHAPIMSSCKVTIHIINLINSLLWQIAIIWDIFFVFANGAFYKGMKIFWQLWIKVERYQLEVFVQSFNWSALKSYQLSCVKSWSFNVSSKMSMLSPDTNWDGIATF
jgi:hypothetical protein